MSPDLLPALDLPGAIALSALALAGGAALARLSSPVACSWPACGKALVARVKGVQAYRRVGGVRMAAGGVVIAALLASGALGAYAAAPAAAWSPTELPAEVQGVIGSVDKQELQVRRDAVDRVGPSSGAAADVLLTQEERALLAKARASGEWNGEAWPGLTLEQTQRMWVNTQRLSDAFEAKAKQSNVQGLTVDEVRAVIGADAFDQQVELSRQLIKQGKSQLPFTQPIMGIGFSVVPGGVQVNYIAPGSTAAQAGLASGDFIVKVNGEDAVTQTNRRMAGDEVLSRDPLAYTLSTGKVITVTPQLYMP